MQSIPLIDWFDIKLEKISSTRNQEPTQTVIKKYFIAELSFGTVLMCILLVTVWLMSIDLLIQYSLVFLLLIVIAWTSFFFVKRLEYVILFMKTTTLLATLYFVARMGGLMTSGGIIIIGIQAVTHTIIFRNYKWMFFIYSLFILSICLLLIFSPYFPSNDLITPSQNLYLFSTNLIVITSFVFIFVLYAVNLYSKLEQKEAQRQKELNEAKTRLYTNITHEFRTPLTVILGLADAMKIKQDENEEAKIDTIIKNGKNLLQLVDQMLDLSKLESGNLTVNKIHGNIIPFLRYVFQLQEYYAMEKNLSMSFNAESQSYEMDFDPEKTTTIVSNFLSNAIKFTPSGGKVDMNIHTSENYLFIEIKDTGIGIPKEKLEKIFERFYQVDDKNTRKAGGTGIGLSLTKELVNLLNGTIGISSIPGVETIFTVKLPVTSLLKKKIDKKGYSFEELDNKFDSTSKEISELIYESSDEKPKLLIVEDNQDVISYLQICYHSSFSIDFALNGKEGCELALKEIPDIIISDVMMPEMDGFELCRKLKEDYRTSHIPVILLTAKADIPSRIEGLEQGADAYIVKPFNQQELLVRMKKLLELRRKLYQRYSNGGNLDSSTNPLIQREDKFFIKLTEKIQENIHNENYNIQALCVEIAMSKSQLYRKFNALTNNTIAKYIKTLRMQKARHLLLTTSMNITEISYEVGMKSLSTFSQLFKDEFGQSPRVYANHVQESN